MLAVANGAAAVGVFVWIAIVWVLPCVVGRKIGNGKGRTNGVWYGFWLGWVGVIILACLGSKLLPSADELEANRLRREIELADLRIRKAEIEKAAAL